MEQESSPPSKNGTDDMSLPPTILNDHYPEQQNGKEEFSISTPNENMMQAEGGTALQDTGNTPPSEFRQDLFMVFITLTQLVQMIPLGAGINSSLALGAALGATRIQSVWIVASYPLTQGSFVLIGACFPRQVPCRGSEMAHFQYHADD
jgi:hypothetical protein